MVQYNIIYLGLKHTTMILLSTLLVFILGSKHWGICFPSRRIGFSVHLAPPSSSRSNLFGFVCLFVLETHSDCIPSNSHMCTTDPSLCGL